MQEVGLERDKVLITNTVKCRPPGNRRPTSDEVRACRPYLEEELQGKEFVLALGLSAAEGLLGRKVKLKEEANREFEVLMGGGPVKVMVTYHPSACVYRPQAREVLREALRAARAYL
jgi:DNA polymerase